MFTLKELLKTVKGKLLFPCKTGNFRVFSTDSRTIKKGEFFIPLKGNKFDGHKFIPNVLKKGALGSLTSKKLSVKSNGKPLVLVKDTLRAFHAIASAHRNNFKVPVIGITGSSGKTTTKDMLASILLRAGRTLKTEENLNNEVGVPKTILKLDNEHRFAVIEMAMQGLGEIEELAKIVRPDVSVITNIGHSHLLYLKNKMNVAKAKSEILKFQKKKDIAVLPFDDKFYWYLRSKAKGKKISFGINDGADITADHIRYKNDSSSFTIKIRNYPLDIDLPLPGKHNVLDALAAAAAAFSLGVSPKKIKNGLENFKLSGKRMDIVHSHGITVIDDTYNANPESMSASLAVLENYPGRKIAVLGDMLELGSISKKSHEDIIRYANELDIDIVMTTGKMMENTRASHHFNGTNDLLASLKKLIHEGDTILVKGSRGMHMEDIVKGLIK